MRQNLYEEVDLIVPGGDYGWSHREGLHAFDLGPGKDMPPPKFKPIAPIFECPRSTGLSITGGCVYHGRHFPELKGACFCADYAFEPAITCLSSDPRDGEMLFCNMAKGTVRQLHRQAR